MPDPVVAAADLWSPTPKEQSPGPESLTPFLPTMPDHEAESDEEFQFDAKHFESGSSTSSTSTSFELINIWAGSSSSRPTWNQYTQ